MCSPSWSCSNFLNSELAGIPHQFSDLRRCAFKSPGSELNAVPGLQTQSTFPAKRVKKCRRRTASKRPSTSTPETMRKSSCCWTAPAPGCAPPTSMISVTMKSSARLAGQPVRRFRRALETLLLEHDRVNRNLDPQDRDAGQEHGTFHVLRHTYGSSLAMKGVEDGQHTLRCRSASSRGVFVGKDTPVQTLDDVKGKTIGARGQRFLTRVDEGSEC